jgi:hypothetical protein
MARSSEGCANGFHRVWQTLQGRLPEEGLPRDDLHEGHSQQGWLERGHRLLHQQLK